MSFGRDIDALDRLAQQSAVRAAGRAPAGADERSRLVAAERTAGEARNLLRDAELASRTAEMQAMEARLQLEQTREQLLVELATIGADGMSALRVEAGRGEAAQSEMTRTRPRGWRSCSTRSSSSALAECRPERRRPGRARRPHAWHRCGGASPSSGAGNPFAVEEYAEVRERLETARRPTHRHGKRHRFDA